MKTRDGVTLRADIYRPPGDGPFPVLLQRTPYDKQNAFPMAQKAVARGYMVVVQDVRGRYTSMGEWYPFKHESEDGYDAIEWAAALPKSNGKVGMFGGSYVGATQMLAAIAHPPHLAGICPVVTASNYHENWTYQGGAFEQWFDQSWTAGLTQNTMERTAYGASNALVAAKTLPLTQFPVFNKQLDMGSPAATAELAPYYLDWLAHPTYDAYWKQWSIEEHFADIQVPALTVAAWYDIFQDGSLRNYLGMKEHAGNDAARNGQRLLVIIGGHAGGGRKIGTVDFGPAAEEFEENDAALEWYDYLLQGKQNRWADKKRVRLFVMGANEWRDEDDWPLARAKATKYFLQSEGKANGAGGDGVLSTGKPGRGADTFIYDPADPVPTVGGPLCCDSAHEAPGPRDQAQVEQRGDVLVYTTPPLDQDVEVTGPVMLDLYARTTAADTDFTGKLVDVWPDGLMQNMTEGILRARYRASTTDEPTPIEPGKVYEYRIDLWSTSNVFKKGHRIRLEVSSSNFPRFDRNLNTGKDAAMSADFVKATTTVLHDAQHPSALVLLVVAGQQ
ncbi:MAG: CocE/NonD family hydrolase [Silvibacterium sp.]|nr:CocE/NonD family hydrolase [Silvibacterium sp.]